MDPGGYGSYNGLLLSGQRRLSNHISLLANYTWSHCIDEGEINSDQLNVYRIPFNRLAERANCDSDCRQFFNLSMCNAVLAYTGHNELEQVNQQDLRAYLYRQTCENRSSDAGLSFSIAVVSLGLNYASREAYCNAEKSENEQHKFDYLKTSTVVEKAISAWVACVNVTKAGILITPTVAPTQVAFSVGRNAKGNGIIRGVTPTGGTICRGGVPGITGTRNVVLDNNINFRLSLTDTWAIVCERKMRESGSQRGANIYPATTITIDTSEGPYMLTLAESPLGAEKWAANIDAGLQQLRRDVKAFEEQQKGTVKACRIVWHTDVTGGGDRVQCPPPYDGTSEYSNAPGWGAAFQIDTDNRAGGCLVSLRLECK